MAADASTREYGLDRRRSDLFLEWPIDEALGYLGPVQRVEIELELLKILGYERWRKGWSKRQTTPTATARTKRI